MKIITMDLDSIVLFLSDMDFSLEEDIECLENNFRDIFIKLKKLYNIDIDGYYEINIYKDNVGVVVDILRDNECFEYYDNQIDMHISIHNDNILFEVNDFYIFPESILKKFDCYSYNNKFYVRVNQKLSSYECSYLLEYSNTILYSDLTKYIVQKNNLI